MSEGLKAGRARYLRYLVHELRMEGAPRETIRRFASYWRKALTGARRELPCPFCFASGGRGWLTILRTNGADLVRCRSCRSEVVVEALSVKRPR
jgi:hypothetical protein